MKKITAVFLIANIFLFSVINFGCATNTNIEKGCSPVRMNISFDESSTTTEIEKVKDKARQYLFSKSREKYCFNDTDELLTLEKTIDEVLMEEKAKYVSSASFSTKYYPLTENGTQTLKAGFYTAIELKIGSGKGEKTQIVEFSAEKEKVQLRSRIIDFFKREN